MNELKFSVLESMVPRIFKETSLNASFCGKNLESSSVEVEKQKNKAFMSELFAARCFCVLCQILNIFSSLSVQNSLERKF